MKGALASWEPQARAVLRIMAAHMILLHGLREVFGFVPARPRGAGSFMPLDPLGTTGGVLLLVSGALVLVGLFTRPAALLLASVSVRLFLCGCASRRVAHPQRRHRYSHLRIRFSLPGWGRGRSMESGCSVQKKKTVALA